MDAEKIKGILKKIFSKVFCLSPLPTILISIPSYALVIYVLASGMENSIISYLAYALSAYALVITITGTAGIIGWIRRGIDSHPLIKKLHGIPVFERFLYEAEFRTETALYQGFAVNLIYAGIKLFSGIYYHSVWFITLAAYYILLAVMRFSLLVFVRGKGNSEGDKVLELRRYRLCGIILLFMDWALVGIIILVVHQNSGFEYPGMLIYVMALYTFYATITAVINVIKFRKYRKPVLTAAKVINLTAALVSMLSLETAMLTQFGAADDPLFRQIMTASTGAGVSMIVLGMAVFMITNATKQLKVIKES